MLSFEEVNRKMLAEKFGPQLDCAREVLALGEDIGESLTKHCEQRCDDYDASTAVVLSVVFAQLLLRCRASVLVWECGYTKECDVLSRSLFELHLAARFIIEPRGPQSDWSSQLRREYKVLSALPCGGISRFSDINFRAILYAARDPLKLDSKTEKFKALPSLRGALPAGFGDTMRQAAAEAESTIGPEWARRIRKHGFHGFSQIKLLAEYCGADKSHYYETLYGIQSGTSHGEGALLLLHRPTRESLARVLCLPCGILGESIEDFDRVFSLGYANRLAVQCGSWLTKTRQMVSLLVEEATAELGGVRRFIEAEVVRLAGESWAALGRLRVSLVYVTRRRFVAGLCYGLPSGWSSMFGQNSSGT